MRHVIREPLLGLAAWPPLDLIVGSSNELQWVDLKIVHQDSSLCYGRQNDMPF